ncbi:MAG: hypothetical protein ABJD24_14710 [Acidimicrobiales bacterium]
MTWAQVVGPLLLTVTSAEGDDEVVEADALRFVGRYVTIDSMRDGLRYLKTVPSKQLARITARAER